MDIDVDIHGSLYLYDRRPPMTFYGFGVRPGTSAAAAWTVDIALTLAAPADRRRQRCMVWSGATRSRLHRRWLFGTRSDRLGIAPKWP
jgi:hypothetical protein